MQEPSIDTQLRSAAEYFHADQLDACKGICESIVARDASRPAAFHLLGMVECRLSGDADRGIALIRKAIALEPRASHYYCSLGQILSAAGRLDEALAAFGEATALSPASPEFARLLAITLRAQHRLPEALDTLQTAIALNPQDAETHVELGLTLRELGRLPDAAAAYGRAIAIRPDYVDAISHLGTLLYTLGRFEQAVVAFQKAIATQPNAAFLYNNLGNALHRSWQFDAAHLAFAKAIELQPDFPLAHANFGNVLKDAGLIDAAIESYERAIKLIPADRITHSNLLYAMHFHPAFDQRALLDRHLEWSRLFADDLTPMEHSRVVPHSRIRVGYVSPAFCDHPVGRYLLPLLAHHDQSAFEIYCYADVARMDAMSERFRATVGTWRMTLGLSDEELARHISRDEIDILVDLTLHTEGSRLLTFARKPAPIQLTFMGYPSTTGLRAMDGRISDIYMDPRGPAGESDPATAHYAEKTLRLADTFFCCFDPQDEEPTVNPLPAAKNGFVTFGSLNNFCKASDLTLDLWARVLASTPASRMIVRAYGAMAQQRFKTACDKNGVSLDRIIFDDRRYAPTDYLRLYHQFDIVLDTFPYAGHTTSIDALWMGVPVVNLVGQTAVSRGGLSILSNVGLADLAAQTPADYVRIATELAADTSRLEGLRSSLRARLRASPIMDAERFARNVEAIYREFAGALPAT